MLRARGTPDDLLALNLVAGLRQVVQAARLVARASMEPSTARNLHHLVRRAIEVEQGPRLAHALKKNKVLGLSIKDDTMQKVAGLIERSKRCFGSHLEQGGADVVEADGAPRGAEPAVPHKLPAGLVDRVVAREGACHIEGFAEEVRP